MKIQDNRNKNDSKNIVFFACIFQSLLGGFGRGLGRVWGGVWSLSGVYWATFGLIFGCLYFEWSPKGAWEASEVDFHCIWRGLGGAGEDFGMFWEEFGTQKDSWKHLGLSHVDNLALSGSLATLTNLNLKAVQTPFTI